MPVGRVRSASAIMRSMVETAIPFETAKRNPYTMYPPGFYRGWVVSRDDPEKMGRVQTRIPVLHGERGDTPDDVLPWCEVWSIGGGTADVGSYEPPLKGTRVLVVFEMGHPGIPMVVSTFRAKPTRSRGVTPSDATLPVQVPPSNEKPGEVDGANDTKIIWHKSWKGNTIMCEDKSDAEYIRVIDRAGNTIELKSPMPSTADRRGTGNSIDGGAQLPAAMSGESHILLKDISGQEVKMTANPTPEITFTTTGRIKLGGALASLALAIAPLLDTFLQVFVTSVEVHTHSGVTTGAGITGPAQGITPIPTYAAWGSGKVNVEGL